MTTLTGKYFKKVQALRKYYLGYIFAARFRADEWRKLTPLQLELRIAKLLGKRSRVAVGMAKYARLIVFEKRGAVA